MEKQSHCAVIRRKHKIVCSHALHIQWANFYRILKSTEGKKHPLLTQHYINTRPTVDCCFCLTLHFFCFGCFSLLCFFALWCGHNISYDYLWSDVVATFLEPRSMFFFHLYFFINSVSILCFTSTIMRGYCFMIKNKKQCLVSYRMRCWKNTLGALIVIKVCTVSCQAHFSQFLLVIWTSFLNNDIE